MKGKYITPEGEEITVHSFDEENKMVTVHVGNGQHLFYIESEYSKWTPADQDTITVEEVDEPEEVTDKPKKKTTKKK